MTTPITDAIHQAVPKPPTKLRLVRTKRPCDPPVHADPRAELRRLVGMHKRWTRTATSWAQSVRDRKLHETGETIACTVPQHVRDDIERAAKSLHKEASTLESAMLAQLRQVPIYKVFLSKVYGIGPVVAAYLCAMIRIERATKPSNLNRYCGNACDPKTGKRELRDGGPKYDPQGNLTGATGTYNDELKMRIYQGMTAMQKNCAKTTADKPNGTTSKYLDRWVNAIHTEVTTRPEMGGKGAFHKGRRKATDLFLEDLYVIWRTLEGLPVWPDLYSVKRGIYHGGKPCVNEGRVLTTEEAFEIVGDFTAKASSVKLSFKGAPVEE
jgi:hypothetical protein